VTADILEIVYIFPDRLATNVRKREKRESPDFDRIGFDTGVFDTAKSA